MAYTVVCCFSLKHGAPMFYECPSHPFGLVASVTNFCRVPAFFIHFCRAFALIVADAYVDDYATVDIAQPVRKRKRSAESAEDQLRPSKHARTEVKSGNGQSVLGEIQRIVGLEFEDSKHQDQAPSSVFLGVNSDLSAADRTADPVAVFSPTPERIEGLMAALAQCQHQRRLDPPTAQVLFGKLNFTIQAIAHGVGRSALQPLLQRGMRGRPEETAWTESLQHMTDFLVTLFDDMLRRPRHHSLKLRLRPSDGRHIILYTDASARGSVGGLGLVFIDLASGDRIISSAMVPATLSAYFGPRGTFINLFETVAFLAAALTLGERLRNRQIIAFIDNVSCLSWCVHGTVNNPEAARLTHAIHLRLASLGAEVFYEYVPSAANIADIPSRMEDGVSADDAQILAALGARTVPMRLPSPEELDDLGFFLRHEDPPISPRE